MAADNGVGAVLVLVLVLGLLCNVLNLLMWCCQRKLHKSQYYFYIQLIIVDLLGLNLWTLISTMNAFTGGLGLYNLCIVQGYFKDFCNLINMHTFLVLAIERVVKIIKPSRHDIIFIDTVVIILLFGVWVFDMVIALLPIIGWSSYTYFPSQFQCTSDTVRSPSHMNFLFVITYCIPILCSGVCYAAIFIRVRKMRNKLNPTRAIVLEEQKNPVGDSYSDRLKRQQEKFNLAGMKKKKPKLRTENKVFTEQGYESDQSSDESETDDLEETSTKPKQIVSKKRQYQLAKSDLVLVRSYMLMTTVYICLWLPYPIATYVYTYDIYGNTPDVIFSVVVCLTHCAAFFKTMIFVIHNPKFRDGFLKTIGRKRKRRVNNSDYSEMTSGMSGSTASVKNE